MRLEASRLEENLPLIGPLGGVRIISSSLLRADRIGCPWAFSAGVGDIVLYETLQKGAGVVGWCV